MVNDALSEINTLLSIDPAESERFAGLIDTFRTRQERLLNDDLNSIVASRENYLAQVGLEKSTVGNELRVADAVQAQQAKRDLNENVRLFGNQLLAEELTRQQSKLEIGDFFRTQDLNKALSSGASGYRLNDVATRGQISANAYQNQLAAFNNRKPSLFSQILSPIAAGAGAAIGSGTLSLGNIFGRGATSIGSVAKSARPVPGLGPTAISYSLR